MTRYSPTPRLVALAGVATLLARPPARPHLSAHRATGRTAASVCMVPATPLALPFTHEFAGVSQTDHQSDVWAGHATGTLTGDLLLTLQLLGSPVEAANPVWKVRTRWTLTTNSDAALVAELYGTVNWKSGLMRLSGAITEGCLAGSEVHADGRFVDLNGSGVLRIFPPAVFSPADVSMGDP